ncbi:MAG: 1-acyl-sn-glycerol-3-phosphate acyltransferase [Bacteroidales bacterium]|nr:1-acyl-sn-glycerol-3-phosphate acyltransferase [Bacteroidales bacterium]
MESSQNSDHQETISREFINLEKVFFEKNPRLTRFIPGFVFSYLKRVIHQDELNKALYDYRDLYGFDFLDAILNNFGVIVHTSGLESLPAQGRYLIAANHPLGGLDGMALMREIGKVRKDFLFPVNDLLMHLPNLKELFIPINKHGSNADNIRLFNETFASGKLLLYFPAGLVSRKQNGKIIDLDWKKTFLSKAIQYQRDIIPVHISGRNTNFFYNLAKWRGRFRIKSNIEMLYLVDEMFKQKDKIIKITFGKPIPVKTFDKRYTHTQWAELIKAHVYAIGRGEDPVIE